MHKGHLDVKPQSSSGHDRYDELCALASSGALTANEWRLLADHLRTCASCRKELAEFQEIATCGMALIAPNDVSLDAEEEWSPESAVAKLMRTIQEHGERDSGQSEARVLARSPKARHGLRWLVLPGMSASLQYAAAIALLLVLSASFYASGVRTGQRRAAAHRQPDLQASGKFDALLRERDELQQRLQSLSAAMASASRDLENVRVVVHKLQAQKQASDETISRLEQKSVTDESEKAEIRAQYQLLQEERAVISAKLTKAEADLLAAQRNLDFMKDQRAADATQIARLETEVASVSSRQPGAPPQYVSAQQVTTAEPGLSELMGARDLFIADVYDIDKSGSPRKPYGRVFYTKGKSLLFYAFDLDQQSGRKSGSTFQVWGRRGYGDTRPLNMGMMFLDSAMSKRWVLNFTDARALSQVDAVFVTIEPPGGSPTPKGRQLLYASLGTPPNHP